MFQYYHSFDSQVNVYFFKSYNDATQNAQPISMSVTCFLVLSREYYLLNTLLNTANYPGDYLQDCKTEIINFCKTYTEYTYLDDFMSLLDSKIGKKYNNKMKIVNGCLDNKSSLLSDREVSIGSLNVLNSNINNDTVNFVSIPFSLF